MVKIIPLAENKNIYPIAAYWAYMNWYLHRNIPFNAILNEYRRRTGAHEAPVTFIALVNDLPAGMVSLKQGDLASRPDLSPWLSALYVAPKFRKRGIGGMLINRVIEESRRLSLDRIYLFIDNRDFDRLKNYYLKRGWEYFDTAEDTDSSRVEIFSLSI